MTRKKGLRAFSKDKLLQELARRHAEELYRDDTTMTDMELLAGPVAFKRSYHYCEECKYGFYPVDRLLNSPTRAS